MLLRESLTKKCKCKFLLLNIEKNFPYYRFSVMQIYFSRVLKVDILVHCTYTY